MMHVDKQGTTQIISKNKKWKEETKYCPACYQIGVQTQLKLYQINMHEAVYLCSNFQNCLYPQADGWCFVNRSINDILSDDESDEDQSDADQENSKPKIQDEVENLIQEMQSEFSQTNNDNIFLNSILNGPIHNKKETSISMLFSEMDNLEEKVVENINENNRVLMKTENKSNYIDNDLLNDLDNFLSEYNEIKVSHPPEENEVSNESQFLEILLPPSNTEKNVQTFLQQSQSPTPKVIIPETVLPLTCLKKESDLIEERIKVVSETLLIPNNRIKELPIDIQNLSTHCFTVECTQLNRISLKTIKLSPDEAGDSEQKNNYQVITQKMDTTKSETMLANQINVPEINKKKSKNEITKKN